MMHTFQTLIKYLLGLGIDIPGYFDAADTNNTHTVVMHTNHQHNDVAPQLNVPHHPYYPNITHCTHTPHR